MKQPNAGDTRTPGKVKAAILKWLGIPIHLTDADFWHEWGSTSNHAGVDVNSRTMLQLSAVWACARLISETIATLPLSMYERLPSGGKRLAPSHRLHPIIHDQPNPDSTASVLWESTVAAMLLRGNGRCEKLTLGDRLVGLRFLDPNRLTRARDRTGSAWEYTYTDSDGGQRRIPQSSIWTVPGFTTNGVEGISVVAHGANVFGGAMAADMAAGRVMRQGTLTGRYYKIDRILTTEHRKIWETAKERVAGAINAGHEPLLEGGMTVGDVGVNPDDAQLLESRGFGIEEIARWFRVPPFMIGHGDKQTSWGTGIEQMMIAFLVFTLGPWLKRIEQQISKDLLTPAERLRFYPKFAVEGLLRADSAARAAFYAVMVNNGILTRDEVRELEDREPMGGNAGVLTVQSAMIPLDALPSDAGAGGEAADVARARAALRDFLGIIDPA